MERTILVQQQPRVASQLVEIQILNAAQTRVALPDVQQLRNTASETIIIKAIRLITAKVLTNGILNGNTNATVAELRKIALTLYSEGWEKGLYIPLLTLNDVIDNDGAAATTIPSVLETTYFDDWKNVDWSKSYLQFAAGTAPVGTPYTVILDVQYVKFYNQNA